jgi:V/A-type H+-transporting ATPase subunit K
MNLGLLGAGLVMGISALGSAIGVGTAGQGVIGAWKRCYVANKPAPMLLLVFAGAPITQIFYGYILMGQMKAAAISSPENGLLYLGFGLASGITISFSAIMQGKEAAAGADSQAETGKGFAQYIAVIGVAETIALFGMVLTMISL